MVRTLKDAWHAGWRIKVRCFVVGFHYKIGHRPDFHCDTTAELDVKTLVWTRGNIPLDELGRKMREAVKWWRPDGSNVESVCNKERACDGDDLVPPGLLLDPLDRRAKTVGKCYPGRYPGGLNPARHPG
jgi:hypothetical protein